jgi:hypothetical protein
MTGQKEAATDSFVIHLSVISPFVLGDLSACLERLSPVFALFWDMFMHI